MTNLRDPMTNLRTAHVYVRLTTKDYDGWKSEWRQVQCETLDDAISIAERMPDVQSCTEASWIPGGVAT